MVHSDQSGLARNLACMANSFRSVAENPPFWICAGVAQERTKDMLGAASFEAHPQPQFVVNASGEVVGANAAGRRLLAGPGSASALAGRLPIATSAGVQALRELLDEALRTQLPSPELELEVPPGLTFSARAIPLGDPLDCALLALAPREPKAMAACKRYRFTPAEAHVAVRLTRGLTVPQIALQLGISVETVRCHLKQAFVKARVHRQAELVAVMLGS